MYGFKRYKEYADYGLDITKKPNQQSPTELYDTPIERLDVNYVIACLKRTKFGEKTSRPNDFFGELQWGDNVGALQVVFSPYGGVKAALRKLIHDQEGNPTWICK